MGVKEVVTAPRCPWQNPYVERIIGSIRRECLDHIIIFNERQLRRVLSSYFQYHHQTRTHLSLDKDCPEPRTRRGKHYRLPGGWWPASSLRTPHRVNSFGDRTGMPVSAWTILRITQLRLLECQTPGIHGWGSGHSRGRISVLLMKFLCRDLSLNTFLSTHSRLYQCPVMAQSRGARSAPPLPQSEADRTCR
jgi:hypothetical protein